MRIILLGAPGSGKGTQAQAIAQRLKAPHVATGDLFREHQAKGSELGKLAKGYMERGEYVPDEVTIRMLLERISQADCSQGYILDGFPRTMAQAQALDQALAQGGQQMDKALYIKVSEEELLRRLGGRWICRVCQTPYHEVTAPPKLAGRCDKDGGELYQRADDSRETARRRLEVYFEQTIPVMEYYRAARKLVTVEGEGSVLEVGQRLLQALGEGSPARPAARKG